MSYRAPDEHSATDKQFSATDVFQSVLASPIKLSLGASACVLLFLFVPAVYVGGSVIGLNVNVPYSGEEMTGWTGWLTFVLFALASVSRVLPALGAYKKLLTTAAFAMALIAVLYAFFESPVASAYQEIHQTLAQTHTGTGGLSMQGYLRTQDTPLAAFSIVPNVGVLLFVAAVASLAMARRREA